MPKVSAAIQVGDLSTGHDDTGAAGKEGRVTETLSVSEAKERLYEIVERVADSGDRFVIESRGRPVAAVVRAEGLSGLQEEADRPEGLLGAVNILSEEDEKEWEETVREIYRQRRQAKPRPAPTEHGTDGLIGAVGAWSEMGDDQIDSMVEEIYRQRRLAGSRSE